MCNRAELSALLTGLFHCGACSKTKSKTFHAHFTGAAETGSRAEAAQKLQTDPQPSLSSFYREDEHSLQALFRQAKNKLK